MATYLTRSDIAELGFRQKVLDLMATRKRKGKANHDHASCERDMRELYEVAGYRLPPSQGGPE